MRVLYTNTDHFLNKRFSIPNCRHDPRPLDIIVIGEILPKACDAVVNLLLITLPAYHCYFNCDPILSDIRGVAICVHHKLQASQVFFNSPHINDHV